MHEHSRERERQRLHVKCIDTYACGYGWLSALDVLSGQLWQASRWGVLRGPSDTTTIDVSHLLRVPKG